MYFSLFNLSCSSHSIFSPLFENEIPIFHFEDTREIVTKHKNICFLVESYNKVVKKFFFLFPIDFERDLHIIMTFKLEKILIHINKKKLLNLKKN